MVRRCLDGTNTQLRLTPRYPSEVFVLLTEATVEKMFRNLISQPNPGEDVFEKAEDLLDEELRAESPLRHRLSMELEELRQMAEKS